MAAGDRSFAAGRRAKANHHGTFVWADSTDADFASTATNQFLIRAANVGIGTASPGQKLTVAGTVESTNGGFKFPDGTTQTTAAVGGGGGGGSFLVAGGLCYANTVRYGRLNGDGCQGNVDVSNTPVALVGTLSNVRVHLSVAPGASESVTVKVYKNSVAQTMSCTISDSATSCLINTNPVSFTAGDLFAAGTLGSAGVVSIPAVMWSAVFTP